MKGIIYKIYNEEGQVYIGSTIKTIEERLSKHKIDYKCYCNGSFNYITSYEVLKGTNPRIECLEEVEFEERRELHICEGKWITDLECVNKSVAGRSAHESRIAYEIKNKDKRSGRVDCECGMSVTTSNLSRHRRSRKHKEIMGLI